MNETQAKEIMSELEALDTHLSYLEDKGILEGASKSAMYFVQIARPFLKTLIDIAINLNYIERNTRGKAR